MGRRGGRGAYLNLGLIIMVILPAILYILVSVWQDCGMDSKTEV